MPVVPAEDVVDPPLDDVEVEPPPDAEEEDDDVLADVSVEPSVMQEAGSRAARRRGPQKRSAGCTMGTVYAGAFPGSMPCARHSVWR